MELNELLEFRYVTFVQKSMSVHTYLHEKLVTKDALHKRNTRHKKHFTSFFKKILTRMS